MPDGSRFDQKAIDAAAQRHLLRTMRRWAPGIALLLAIGLVIAYIPPTEESATRVSDTNGGAGDPAAASATSAPSSNGAGSEANGPTTTQAVGTSRGGVVCGGDARQVPWSRYAPSCVPAFQGANGGATAAGVTDSTITVGYRISSSGESAAVGAAAGAAGGGTDAQYVADLQTYIALFNTQFELYGRQVALKVFNGKGDWLQETQQQNAAGAQADAATAHDMGAFADISVISMTQLYAEALADQKILSFGAPYMSSGWFADRAPYGFSHWPANDRVATFLGTMACSHMVGLPAVFAGDARYKKTNRVFGIIVPENPVYASGGDVLKKAIIGCGGPVPITYRYALDISQAAQSAAGAMAQMKSNNVTTVLCLCDPIAPIFLTPAATQQQYQPEWVTNWWGDSYGRQAAQVQWSHTMTVGGQSPKGTTTEAYRAFKLADATGEPQETYYNLPYWQTLMLFNGLQAAGPALTPASFAKGSFSNPGSLPGGDFGPWSYSNGSYSPLSDFQLGFYDANATSLYDGKRGAYENCNGGAYYRWNNQAAIQQGGHTQPHCFGT